MLVTWLYSIKMLCLRIPTTTFQFYPADAACLASATLCCEFFNFFFCLTRQLWHNERQKDGHVDPTTVSSCCQDVSLLACCAENKNRKNKTKDKNPRLEHRHQLEIMFLMRRFVSTFYCMSCKMSAARAKCNFFSLLTAEGEESLSERKISEKPSEGCGV